MCYDYELERFSNAYTEHLYSRHAIFVSRTQSSVSTYLHAHIPYRRIMICYVFVFLQVLQGRSD